MSRKFLSAMLSVCLVLSLFPGISYGTEDTSNTPPAGALSDIRGHWAQESIQSAVSDGYVKGYPDGRFLPEKPVSRAEFVSMVNNALQLRDENTVILNFTDVDASDWFYEEVAKAGYVRYVQGTGEATFSPEAYITRQEAALMLSRFLPRQGMTQTAPLDDFPDRSSIAGWAEEGLAVVVNKGYMKGHADGRLAPLGTLTRAEAVTLISQILAKETIVREDVFVKTSGQILQDKIYVGDITIDEALGDGDATLQNLSALSVVYVNGGGQNTVDMEYSLIIRLVVTKEGTKVRVLAGNGTNIYTSILFNDNLLVDGQGNEAQPDGETFQDIVVVQGTVTKAQSKDVAAAIGALINNDGQVTPEQVAQAVLSVLTNSTTNTNAAGAIVVTVPPAPRPRTDGNNANQLTSAVVDGETDYISATVAAIAAPAAATVTYQWLRSGTAAGVYTAIPDATGAEYIITEEDIGQFLKVTATATGAYTGTQTSAAAGPIGFAGGAGTEEDPYQIGNWFHLDNMRYLRNSSYLLTANLTSEEVENAALSVHESSPVPPVSKGYAQTVSEKEGGWEPVGQFYQEEANALSSDFHASQVEEEEPYFTGTFDGNNKIINDLYIYRPDVVELGESEYFDYACGLFGVLYLAEVGNVELRDASVQGTDYVGALAGYSRESAVSGVTSISTVEPTNVEASFVSAGVFGETRVGGIVGRNDVSLIENCVNSSQVQGIQYVGGIAGSNYAEEDDLIEAASVHASDGVLEARIQGCENEGYILGWAYTGGIAGGNGYSREVEQVEYINGKDSPAFIHQCANYGFVDVDTSLLAVADFPIKFGGIAGGSTGTISECFNIGSVGGLCFATGGIVGSTNGVVENCYNNGSISSYDYYGGIVGYAQEATLRFNYNVGDVYNYNVDSLRLEVPYQICGYDEGQDSDEYEESEFMANFYLEDEVEDWSLMDPSDFEGVYSAKAEELRNPLNFKEMETLVRGLDLPAWDFQNVWAANLQDNEGYPFLKWQWNAEEFNSIPLGIEMPVPAAIALGQTLAEATLEGGAVAVDGVPVPGTFEYWDEYYIPEEEYLGLEGMTAYVIFLPESGDYLPFAGTVFVEIESTDLGEPNNTSEAAVSLELGQIQAHHWIMPETDVDWFSFTAEADQLYRISTLNLYPDAEDELCMDTYMYLYDSDATEVLGENDDYIDLDSCVLWSCTASGIYYVQVMHYDQYYELDYGEATVTEYSVGRYDILVEEMDLGENFLNGGFETGDFEGWNVEESGLYPLVQSEVVHSGEYAAHLGDGAAGMYPPDGDMDLETASFLSQMLYVQDNSEAIPQLDFYFWIDTTDDDGEYANDYLEVSISYYDGYEWYTDYLDWWWYEGTEGWEWATLDMSDYAGYPVEIYFEVRTYNGEVENNYYIDDVSVEYVI